MIIVGLTGSIGAGKSTVARAFRHLNVPVDCADKKVLEELQSNRKLIECIVDRWPQASFKEGINRRVLAEVVFKSKDDLYELERLIFPYLVEKLKRFLCQQCKRSIPYTVLDIPLLFETNLKKKCDFTIVVKASKKIRQQRVLKLSKITKGHLSLRESFQYAEVDELKEADYILHSGLSIGDLQRQVLVVKKIIEKTSPQVWGALWSTDIVRKYFNES